MCIFFTDFVNIGEVSGFSALQETIYFEIIKPFSTNVTTFLKGMSPTEQIIVFEGNLSCPEIFKARFVEFTY